jgi:hypothetical protein
MHIRKELNALNGFNFPRKLHRFAHGGNDRANNFRERYHRVPSTSINHGGIVGRIVRSGARMNFHFY